MADRFADLSDRYNALDGNLGQIVRRGLISRQLEHHLAPSSGIVDVGGGAGQQSIPLARKGHHVTILDPSPKMLAEARRRLEPEDEGTRRRMRLVEGAGENLPAILGTETFDAALCHGVVMYLDDPRPMIRSLAAAVRPGGFVSVLAKNAAALAFRPALKGDYKEALELLDADRAAGRLGVVTRADTVEGLSETFEEAGLIVKSWYGVRVFTDHVGDRPPGDDLPDVLELEWEAGRRDPYRSVARMIHIVGRRRQNP